MNSEEIKQLPLAVLIDVKNLLDSFDSLYKMNSDIILRVEDNETPVLKFVNIGNDEYSFTIKNPKLQSTGNQIVYFCNYKPSNDSNFNGQEGVFAFKNIKASFDNWINLMRELEKYRNILSEPFLKEYTDEFFAEFEFVEEDDDNNHYGTQKQIDLYNALDKLELYLKTQEQSEIIEGIIKETIDLKENIQNISKGATKKRVAKMFAKIKKGGIKVFKDVVEVGYKEIIKAALHSGTDVIGHLL
jgi:hypothetical protein